MKEHPILFSGEMVRAILDGRKTQTRRIILKSSMDSDYNFVGMRGIRALFQANRPAKRKELLMPCFGVNCQYGEPGTRLWVKETFKTVPVGNHIVYRADAPTTKAQEVDHAFGPWKPSIFMPRKLSRITLEITAVRVERLQDISEEDAKAEGSYLDRCACMPRSKDRSPLERMFILTECHIHGKSYKTLWESINGKGSWSKNPLVWVIQFRKL